MFVYSSVNDEKGLNGVQVVESVLVLEKLGRENLHDELTCRNYIFCGWGGGGGGGVFFFFF